MTKAQPDKPVGRARLIEIVNGEVLHLSDWYPNSTLKSASRILFRLFSGKAEYALSTMYIEFANSASPVSPPVVTVNDTLAYYSGLSLSATNDYIRAPIVGFTEESSDPLTYPIPNVGYFLAASGDTVGVHGKTFDLASNSRVIGGAIVATPVPGDPSQDIMYARFYLASPEQQSKSSTGQTGLVWKVQF